MRSKKRADGSCSGKKRGEKYRERKKEEHRKKEEKGAMQREG